MTVRLTGELPAGEIEHSLFAIHWWARDTRNHRYLREQLEDRHCDFLQPECSKARFTIPARYAFRDELSPELGEDRERSRDCPSCFRGLR
jgi:hypothetical protein